MPFFYFLRPTNIRIFFDTFFGIKVQKMERGPSFIKKDRFIMSLFLQFAPYKKNLNKWSKSAKKYLKILSQIYSYRNTPFLVPGISIENRVLRGTYQGY